MNRFLVAAFVLVSPAAYAQTTSDLMPALPTPSSGGGGGYYYPGMPTPSAPSSGEGRGSGNGGSVSRGGEGGGSTAETGRRSYEIYDTPGTVSRSDGSHGMSWDNGVRVDPDHVPDIHVVRRGDTLWDIAGYYFRNPWTWPKLWALNPTITNPHWIYPGDIVRLLKESGAVAPVVPVAADVPRARTPVRTDGIFLRQTGFVEPDELKHAGTLIGSKEEKILLSTNDEGYVEMSKEKPLRVGERYTVYRPIEEVKHPVSHKKLGVLVQILGEADVKSVTDGKMARIKLVDSTDPIERGYRVGPLRRQFKIVEPVPNPKEHEGVVVVNLRPVNLVAQGQLTFVDLGKQDGVMVGNRLFITRRGDGYQNLLGTYPIDDPKYPREIVGEIIVIDTRDHISTGLVTKSVVDSRIGDRVEARKGY